MPQTSGGNCAARPADVDKRRREVQNHELEPYVGEVPPNVLSHRRCVLQLDVQPRATGNGEDGLPGPAVEQRQGQSGNHAIGLADISPAAGRVVVDHAQPGIVDSLETPTELRVDLETCQPPVLRQPSEDLPSHRPGAGPELDHPDAAADLFRHRPGQDPAALERGAKLPGMSQKLPRKAETIHIAVPFQPATPSASTLRRSRDGGQGISSISGSP